MIDELAVFYGVLKTLELNLRLVYITGILKYSSMSLFSKLNNIDDHTFDPRVSTICGYTDEELRINFAPHLAEFARKWHYDSDADAISALEQKFNGYRFGVNVDDDTLSTAVFNPFAINCALREMSLDDKWLQSGRSRYLIQRIVQSKASGKALDPIDISLRTLTTKLTPNSIPYEALMYYAGYSTIIAYDHKTNMVTLAPPNDSITEELLDGIDDAFRSQEVVNEDLGLAKSLVGAMFGGAQGLEKLHRLLNKVLALYPHQLLKQNKALESTYNVLFSSWFKLGCHGPYEYLDNEWSTSTGDIEFAIADKEAKVVCIGEFKFNPSAAVALNQVREKGFKNKFPHYYRAILVGINVSSSSRQVDVSVEEVNLGEH
jgi:hypothetical protein